MPEPFDKDFQEWVRDIERRHQPGPPIRVVMNQPDGSRKLGHLASARQTGDVMELHVVMDDPGADQRPFDHVWWWRSRLPERKGQRCRVLARGAKNSVLVQFEDGECVVTSRYAVRRAATKGGR